MSAVAFQEARNRLLRRDRRLVIGESVDTYGQIVRTKDRQLAERGACARLQGRGVKVKPREEWRAAPSWPGYEVSSRGRVRLDGWMLRAHPNDGGYMRVRLRGESLTRHVRVHLLVLLAFVGPAPSPRHEGAHLDGNRRNNRLDNLAWKTPEENAEDKRRHGTATGDRRRGRVTSEEEVRAMRERHARGESFTALARELRLHRHSVARIVRGQRRAAA